MSMQASCKLSRWERDEMKGRIRGGAKAEFLMREYGINRAYANWMIRKVRKENAV